VINVVGIEREGDTGKTRDSLLLDGLIPGQALEKHRGTS